MVHRTVAVTLGVFALTAVAALSAAAQTGPKCSGAKQKAAGKKAGALLGCYSKAATKAVALDAACVMKADGKFTTAFGKSEAKGGCVTTGDAAAIEGKIDACAADINDDLYTSGEDKCAGAKIKAAGKKTAAVLSCYAKAVSKGTPLDSGCIAKADGKLTSAFSKAEAKGGCNTTGDAAAIETKIDSCTADVADDLTGPSTTTTTTVTGSTTTTSTTGPPGQVLKGALTATLGRFNYNLQLGLAGSDAACNMNFPGTHSCTYAELQAAEAAGDLDGLRDTASNIVTSFWAIDSGQPPLSQCVDDAAGGSNLNWEYGTAHTASRGQKVALTNATGVLGSLVSGVQCNIAGSNWVGCCQ